VHPLLHLVLVALRVPGLGGDLLDDLLREPELGGLELRHVGQRHLVPRLHLGGVAELVHDEAVLERPQLDDVLLAAGRVRGHADEPGLEHRVVEQLVRALAALVRPEVVALLDVQRIDRGPRHELLERDRLRRDRVERLELLGREDHVLALAVLVALHRVLAVDDLVALRADVLLAEPGAVRVVQHVEVDVSARLVRRVELRRDRDEPERDGRGTDATGRHV
jgi:hypothetical protein